MDQTLKLPLSGDVSQLFDIFAAFNQGGRIGLFNIEMGASGNPALEREMLVKVGSYGRQIGQITDALRVVVKMLRDEPVTRADEDALELFEIQARIADLVKRGRDIAQARAEEADIRRPRDEPMQGVIWPLLTP